MSDDGLDLSWKMHVAAGVNELKREVHKTAVEHGWWDIDGGNRNMGEMMMLMVSEISEALESYRDSEPPLWFKHNFGPDFMHGPDVFSKPHDAYSEGETFRGKLGKPEGIAAEFADVIIRILDTCEKLDIPITRALVVKHAYNKTRPYRHGGKLC